MLPGFKATMERYLAQVQTLGYEFIGLLAEAFGLSSDALARFYDSDDLMQHRGKVGIMYFNLRCLHDFIPV
jgi:isopenicillin N synthase-like dioxygenase